MKSLTLYIDKWYIVGAVNSDGAIQPLRLPNDEDRVWLFFFEDQDNHVVTYGKSFEAGYRDEKLHYIGDVFAMMDQNRSFNRWRDLRGDPAREIFACSEIFQHLHDAVQTEEPVDTYISFSQDVSYPARLDFLDEMRKHGFNVKVSVAKISHLALEECRRRSMMIEPGMYLVLEATNENLRYYIYEYTAGLYLRKNEDCLQSMGQDMRRRSLIKYVLDNINNTERLYSSSTEYEAECQRLERYTDEWLARLSSARQGMPVPLSGIYLSVAPNNRYNVQVVPRKIDESTKAIVNTIIDKIMDFIRDSNLYTYDIKGMVLIGNTFTNEQFREAISRKFVLSENEFKLYRDEELSRIVNVYAAMDITQFDAEASRFIADAEAEAERLKIAREEEEKRREAEEEKIRMAEIQASDRRREQNFAEAISKAEKSERDCDYDQMIQYLDIALTLKPDDPFARNQKDRALQLQAKERAISEEFNKAMYRIRDCMREKRWNDAISQCDVALGIRPEASEPNRLKNEARKHLDAEVKIEKYLLRVDNYISQRQYDLALAELGKIELLEPNHPDALSRKEEINKIKDKHMKAIKNLVEKLNGFINVGDLNKAIDICGKLENADSANVRKWAETRERLKQQLEKQKEQEELLEGIKKKIDDANFRDNYEEVVKLCHDYLAISDDTRIRRILEKAKRSLEKQRHIKEGAELINKIKADISDGNLDDAEKALRMLRQNHPELALEIKSLSKRLFNKQERSEIVTPSQTGRNPVGFMSSGSDDFFESQPQSQSLPSSREKRQKKEKNKNSPQKSTDFFDETHESNVDNVNRNKNLTTYDDFNF